MIINSNLEGKKVLFFSPAFFNYEIKIKDKMIEMGAEVDMYDERSVTKALDKALLKIEPNIFKRKTEKYYFEILEQIKTKKYDYILFIKCDMATEKVLELYRNTFKDSLFCLYLWDSLKNIPHIERKIKYFDIVKSFDMNDVENNHNLKFRPLFYCDEYKKENNRKEYKYDLCFIGTIHADRYRILKNIKEEADKLGLSIYYYPFLQSKFIYYFYKLTKKEFRSTNINDFKFDKISANEISKKVDESKVIIDIQHPRQTGLTMRTIEMLGMNKKIVTTNAEIEKYDFYNPDNIQIINRESPIINNSILNKEYEKISDDIYLKYYIESWVYEVLDVEK